MNCVETSDLSFYFKQNEIIINNINLCVPQGAIYGFIGPNGAGKTTTLKLIVGLLKIQKGIIKIFNETIENNRIEILKKIGSLIESPSFYSHLTAFENLRIMQKIYQCPKNRINEVLEIVGLTGCEKKKTGQFSLGMKQRLGIAISLMHNPELLILDEPTNGLDPNGIIEIRDLLLKLNKTRNITIIVSSHLLSEIEKIVTHIGIINKGYLLFQGTLEELQFKQKITSRIIFETSNIDKTFEVFRSFNLKADIKNGFVEITCFDKELVAKLNQQLLKQGVDVYQIAKVKNDLESIFIDIIKN